MSDGLWLAATETSNSVASRNRQRTYRRVRIEHTPVSRSFDELYADKPANSWSVVY
jgi:hypothetical protein